MTTRQFYDDAVACAKALVALQIRALMPLSKSIEALHAEQTQNQLKYWQDSAAKSAKLQSRADRDSGYCSQAIPEIQAAPANETRPVRVYIAGPMSDLPDHNFPAFHLAARQLRAAGFHVISPAELNHIADGLPRQLIVSRDLQGLLLCDSIVLLPGWEKSEGAKAERHVAEWAHMHVYVLADLLP